MTLLSLAIPDTVARIREVFNRAGYSETHILQLLEVEELLTFRQRWQVLPLYLWRTREETALHMLVRLFLLRQSASLSSVRQAVAPMAVESWVASGLLEIEHEEVKATVELLPYQDLIVAADWPEQQEVDPYQVMGIAASSRTLAQMTIRRHATRTLDLGTGCGVLAFLAARHSDQLVAVDRNTRALLMTQFNAQLNGITNLTYREGDLFSSVEEQAFDLIMCNPPFVIAPGQGVMHTHSGYPADQLCQTIIRTAPTFLREGGFCQLLCNWVQISGQDWRERLASWCMGTDCDVWVLHSHTENAAEYALKRLKESVHGSPQLTTQFSEWMAYYEQEKIEAIGFGLITLRRSSKPAHWFRCDRLPEVIGPCGDAIERGFRLRDFLETHREDQALLNVRLRQADNLRWEQVQHSTRKGWTISRSQLQLTSGLAYTGNVDANVVEFVAHCNGELRLGAHLKKIASSASQKTDIIAPSFLKVVRRLIESGCLLPVEEA